MTSFLGVVYFFFMNFRCSILGSPIDFKHIIVLIDKKKLYFLKTIQFNTINYNASQI